MPDSMTLDTLQAVAELAPQPKLSNGSQQRSPSNQHNGSTRLRVADWLTDRGVRFRLKDSPTSDGRDVYLLAECPFNPEHRSPDSCIMQERSGRTSFKCLHATCAGRGWSDVKEAIGKPLRDHYDGLTERDQTYAVESSTGNQNPEPVVPSVETADGQPLAATSFDLRLMDSATFASTNFRRHYLVKRVLVEGQPCIIGGPKKCLKTGTLVDLAVSLGTGTPFLSNPDFIVPERVRTCVLSGESGGFTLKETAKRICEARNRTLATADVLWGFDLPQLANPIHLDIIEKTIQERGIRVLFIDPAYLCLLSGTDGVNPGSVFAMGPILKPIGELGARNGCTIIVAHHTKKKDRKDRYQPTDLDDLSMSGFAEWARQWLLLGRRAEYRGDGKHDLWLNVGGSAGHSGCHVLAVDEGVAGDDTDGRHWDTKVESASVAIERSREAAERRKAEGIEDRRLGKLEALTAVIRKHPDGETKSQLRTLTKPQPTAVEFDEMIADLIQRGAVEACDVKKNGTNFSGFRPLPMPEE